MIEDVPEAIRAWDVEHHVVHFYEKDSALCFRIADLPEDGYSRKRDDPLLRQQLEATVQGELLAHFRYLMFADRAERRGMRDIARAHGDPLAEQAYLGAARAEKSMQSFWSTARSRIKTNRVPYMSVPSADIS